jgi:hypothetical protein
VFTHKKLMPYALLSGIAAFLTLIAAASGLLVPNFYSFPTANLLIGSYAQDLIALVVAALLLAAVVLTWRGSVRAVMVWAGCLGYLIYGYILYTFNYTLTSLYPVYIAILGLSLFSIIGLLGTLDIGAFQRSLTEGLPTRLVAVVLAIPVLLIPPWIALVMQAVATQQANPLLAVNVIDLSFVIPACLVSAVLVWRKQAWGLVFAGVLLIQLPVYIAFALLGGGSLVSYLRHIVNSPQLSPRKVRMAAAR